MASLLHLDRAAQLTIDLNHEFKFHLASRLLDRLQEAVAPASNLRFQFGVESLIQCAGTIGKSSSAKPPAASWHGYGQRRHQVALVVAH